MPWGAVAVEIFNWPADLLQTSVRESVLSVSAAVVDVDRTHWLGVRRELALIDMRKREAVAQADAAMAELLVSTVLQPLCILWVLLLHSLCTSKHWLDYSEQQ